MQEHQKQRPSSGTLSGRHVNFCGCHLEINCAKGRRSMISEFNIFCDRLSGEGMVSEQFLASGLR